MPSSDLRHEVVGEDAQSDQIDTQGAVSAKHQIVVAQVVRRDHESGAVLDAVDLDAEPIAPPDVEVDAPSVGLDEDLAVGLGQAPFAAKRCEVQLAERLHPEGDVAHDQPHKASPTSAANPLRRFEQLLSSGETLLDGHHQDECCLSIADCPLRPADRRDSRPRAWETLTCQLAVDASDHLVQRDGRGAP